MRTTFDERKLSPPERGTVVSIGVFDGVHLGHQAILARNVSRARELGAVPAVLTFRRHPKRVLLGRAPRTLTTLEHRLELFRRAGIEDVCALPFDDALRAVEAEEFAERFLERGMGARALVLGFDSKFGHGRRGTPELLRSLGWDVEVVPQVVVGSRAVSSTAIREAVELGDLAAAAEMLGRPVSVLGRVVHGDALGRKLGFPTANLDLVGEHHPPVGVWAGRAHVLDGPWAGSGGALGHAAVANIGFRPTLAGEVPNRPRVEVHLFDFSGDLYGERLEFEFTAHLREERTFDGLEALEAQIGEDARRARELLAP